MYSKKTQVVLNRHKDHDVVCMGINEITFNFLMRVATSKDQQQFIANYLTKKPAMRAIIDEERMTIKGRTIYWSDIVSIYDASKYDKEFERTAKGPRLCGASPNVSPGVKFYWDFYRDRYHYYNVGLLSWKESWESLLTALSSPNYLIAYKINKQYVADLRVQELPEESEA